MTKTTMKNNFAKINKGGKEKMMNTELKNMAILEMTRGIESAFLGLDKTLEEKNATEKERKKAFEYLEKMQMAFIKKYIK